MLKRKRVQVYVSVCFYVSLCVCMSMSLCVCMSMCLCVSMCLYVSVCLCVCMSLCVCVSVCLCVFMCLYVYMSLCVCMFLYVSVCLCMSLYVCVSAVDLHRPGVRHRSRHARCSRRSKRCGEDDVTEADCWRGSTTLYTLSYISLQQIELVYMFTIELLIVNFFFFSYACNLP